MVLGPHALANTALPLIALNGDEHGQVIQGTDIRYPSVIAAPSSCHYTRTHEATILEYPHRLLHADQHGTAYSNSSGRATTTMPWGG